MEAYKPYAGTLALLIGLAVHIICWNWNWLGIDEDNAARWGTSVPVLMYFIAAHTAYLWQQAKPYPALLRLAISLEVANLIDEALNKAFEVSWREYAMFLAGVGWTIYEITKKG